GDLEAAPGRLLDQLGARPQVLTHDRSVDDLARLEPAGAGRDCGADRDRPFRNRLALDLVTAGALDRPGDAGAHPQVVVSGVGDCVDIERGYVPDNDLELEHVASIAKAMRHHITTTDIMRGWGGRLSSCPRSRRPR